MAESTISMSSRSFREMLLTASIRSVFGHDHPREPPASTNARNHSPTTIQASARTGTDMGSTMQPSRSMDVGHTPVNTPCAGEKGEGAQNSGDLQAGDPHIILESRREPFVVDVHGGVEYRTMGWWHAGLLMVAETISLGILSLPSALAILGMIPGIILLTGLGAMASYSGYVIGQFKTMYPHVHSWADAGEILLGRPGREVFGASQLLFFIFIMASHVLTFSVMMNAITDHGTCTVAFSCIGTIVSIAFTLPRTLKHVSYYSVVSFISIAAAVLVTIIAVGITQPGRHLDLTSGHWVREVRLWPRPDVNFHKLFLAITNIVFAYAGHAAFFSFISELKDARDFPKALAFLQISDISLYIITALVIYYYVGDHIASPALNNASPTLRKVAYGVAIPTIVIAGVVNGHVAVKYLYVRLLRDRLDGVMYQRSPRAIGLWIAICSALWMVAWIIAGAVPVFNDLLSVTGALFASWLTFGLSGVLWFHMNFRRGTKCWLFFSQQPWTWRKSMLFSANVFNLLAGGTICVLGLYASGKSIALNSSINKPFSCADNSSPIV